MKPVLIVYHSHDGNTELVARTIAKANAWETLRLVPVDPIKGKGLGKWFWGGRQVVTGVRPQLEPYDFSADERPLVVVGSPIWAASYTPAIAAFLDAHAPTLTHVAAFFCHAGGGAAKAIRNLQEVLGDTALVSTLDLRDPARRNREEQLTRAVEWASRLSGLVGA